MQPSEPRPDFWPGLPPPPPPGPPGDLIIVWPDRGTSARRPRTDTDRFPQPGEVILLAGRRLICKSAVALPGSAGGRVDWRVVVERAQGRYLDTATLSGRRRLRRRG